MIRRLSEQDLIALNALVDGELDVAASAALEARIAAEPDLRDARDAILAGREAVAGLPRPALSADLRSRIESLIGDGATAEPRRSPMRPAVGWRSLAAAIVVSAAVASGMTYLLVRPGEMSLDLLIAAGHRRSLLAASPVDVASSDRHTVKPWLDARLGISPPAPDLATQGFVLLGGRVDVLGDQAVPALVYRHNEHTITLVSAPAAAGSTTPRDFAAGGYNMARWSEAGFSFTAVSDLEAAELEAFVADYRAALGPIGIVR